jgi:aldose sugar dehydrogenase
MSRFKLFILGPNICKLENRILSDGVANSSDSRDQIIFGNGFGGITNLKVSPYDGYPYMLTFDETKGTIYRIVPVKR